MPAKVIAIAMDSADGELVERWMDAGLLPGLARLRREGAWGRIAGGRSLPRRGRVDTLLTGCEPERTGYWTELVFDPGRTAWTARGAYDFVAHPQFHALGDARRVAVVDVPQTRPSPDVAGPPGDRLGRPRAPAPVVLLAAGAVRRAGGPPRAPPGPQEGPRHLLEPGRGRAPAAGRCGSAPGAGRAICAELLAREPWDLFMTAFSETHSAGHHLWHLSARHGHPLYRRGRDDPLLEAYRAVDRAAQELSRPPATRRPRWSSPPTAWRPPQSCRAWSSFPSSATG